MQGKNITVGIGFLAISITCYGIKKLRGSSGVFLETCVLSKDESAQNLFDLSLVISATAYTSCLSIGTKSGKNTTGRHTVIQTNRFYSGSKKASYRLRGRRKYVPVSASSKKVV